MAAPQMTYFPIAGRGELVRLIAHVGGVEMGAELAEASDDQKFACGSPSGLPILTHGDLKLSQSTAIESYIDSISPKFAELTPQQKAKDAQFRSIKEDVLGGFSKVLFGSKDPAEFKAVADKWFPVIEGILPADGFINRCAFPTCADLAVYNICTGVMPFTAAYKVASIDLADHPKLKALSDRVGACDEMYEFNKATQDGNPWGM